MRRPSSNLRGVGGLNYAKASFARLTVKQESDWAIRSNGMGFKSKCQGLLHAESGI